MSKEAFEAMMQAAGQDSSLQTSLEAADGYEEVVKIGATKGYEFTAQEAENALQERGLLLGNSSTDELSDEALEAVAGGIDWGWTDNVRINLDFRGW